jgi:hypothetical protein
VKITETFVNAKTGETKVVERELTEQEIAEMEARQNEFKWNNELMELDNWFKNNYTMYEQMLVRRKTLGIEDEIFDEFRNKTYKSVLQLYNEAEVVAGEIRVLKEKLKTEV